MGDMMHQTRSEVGGQKTQGRPGADCSRFRVPCIEPPPSVSSASSTSSFDSPLRPQTRMLLLLSICPEWYLI